MITIIPAIDIIDGQCVRLTKGDYQTKKMYNENPLEIAKQFENAGIKRLHMVDLDGAREKHIVNWAVLEEVSKNTSLHVDFGGGLQSNEDLRIAFDCGANQITAGSIAVRNEAVVLEWIAKHGSDRIILGADVIDEKITISGWQEKTEIDLSTLVSKYMQVGIKTVICTDVSKDGMLEGPSFDLYSKIKKQFPELNIIASGGISSIEDVERLNELGIDGVIIGKALYEGRIDLQELTPFLC